MDASRSKNASMRLALVKSRLVPNAGVVNTVSGVGKYRSRMERGSWPCAVGPERKIPIHAIMTIRNVIESEIKWQIGS